MCVKKNLTCVKEQVFWSSIPRLSLSSRLRRRARYTQSNDDMYVYNENKQKKEKEKTKGHESRNADASVKERGMTEGAYREKRNNDVTLLLAIVFALFFFLYDFLRSLSLSFSPLSFRSSSFTFFFLTLCHFFLSRSHDVLFLFLSLCPSLLLYLYLFLCRYRASFSSVLPPNFFQTPFPFLPPYLPA